MFRFLSKRHSWKYRNPAARTCKNCGRNENFYEFGQDLRGLSIGEWEEMYPLATNREAKCYKRKE